MNRLVKVTTILAVLLLFLAACSSSDEAVNTDSATDLVPQGSQNIETHSADGNAVSSGEDEEVGFELAGGVIEEAANVPAEEKEAIENAFRTYIEAFNDEDLESYLSVISKQPQGFSYETEKQFVTDTFEQYDTKRSAEDITIIKYNEQEAQVYSTVSIDLEQHSTGGKATSSGRQVTVFAKEDGNWLVTSVYFIRD
ncbi:nuclear transport factor 2 family protein [Tetzosporium hominis]|uniref:nuclear transport factor 2 family protein n=1 Tax=Tetzosporium hominis TaxID=2020506 RepID=UPI001FAF2227|nr:nuclear transport factor 2 family protein [Tetzosporium hominis]